ncbi:uncharacterized protein BO95DRAFT_487559 [Aspergillus brunneoviolaceus CBS 621.78]|uniref:Uncharacterized protein n=1 Tax=Aspergillus brunneoviolaceus CBS 621.78 TaxID=1450534 RepID=A0ACD1GJE7_9EURO|nr:hypothetical protein BO95DRAFT_487559 [Aspergillus brunneoviolaceus CBS 621.78]RAH49297.1 hypothetical protein BO95DRAFT_487559 [Aspergillus brunneoviolaceus CBS 621.78]
MDARAEHISQPQKGNCNLARQPCQHSAQHPARRPWQIFNPHAQQKSNKKNPQKVKPEGFYSHSDRGNRTPGCRAPRKLRDGDVSHYTISDVAWKEPVQNADMSQVKPPRQKRQNISLPQKKMSSDRGNRTPGCRVRDGDVSHYTISESVAGRLIVTPSQLKPRHDAEAIS